MLNRLKPLVSLILNGFSYSLEQENNAIAMATPPCRDRLQKDYPTTVLHCSGNVAGLLDEQMGNSEVGHIHIGSGRYAPQAFSKVNNAIKDGGLSDLALTMLNFLGMEQPVEMSGRSLIKAV